MKYFAGAIGVYVALLMLGYQTQQLQALFASDYSNLAEVQPKLDAVKRRWAWLPEPKII